eukprot:gnl/TRDRNA2_/TRDRNA2_203997_c0_seq1.p1 gnl/TRDRNA2_/TRDRNA2_203997_c0~~gnl/TRDRNA2_/TRDRNA2_203997_c0_seq1.p1  ORF type:complete len:199 (-),score=32.23 gnl/TRDRNA2_/TRDRNA2_203997_c0_seq1:106-657(-)
MLGKLIPLLFTIGSAALLAGSLAIKEVPHPFIIGPACYLSACLLSIVASGGIAFAIMCFTVANTMLVINGLCGAGFVVGAACDYMKNVPLSPILPHCGLFVGSATLSIQGPGITSLSFLIGAAVFLAGGVCSEHMFDAGACAEFTAVVVDAGVVSTGLFLVGSLWMLLQALMPSQPATAKKEA